MLELTGELVARDLTFGIVLARYNSRVTDVLLAGALDGLTRHGANPDRITVVRVPGAMEILQGLRLLARPVRPQGRRARAPSALLALGALIRGETPHFDHLAAVVTRGVERICAETGVPIANGVLTCETLEQALERAGGKAGNKGFDAALTAIEMANLTRLMAAP